jgi:hypothetical protein
MKTAAFLISLIALPLALPAQARDDDLSVWLLEDLCEKKDKDRHADAVLAELERRAVFGSLDLELIRSGDIDVGMEQAALQCSLGEPEFVRPGDGDAWYMYRQRIDGQRRTVFVHVIAERVTDIDLAPVGYKGRPAMFFPYVARNYAPRNAGFTGAYFDTDNTSTFSGRTIDGTGVSSLTSCDTCSIFDRR